MSTGRRVKLKSAAGTADQGESRNRRLLDRAQQGWVGSFTQRFIELRLLDRIYQVSAVAFVAYIPLILALSVLFTGGQSAIAEQLVTRFGLTGAAAQTVRQLLDKQTQGVYWLGLIIVLWSAFSLGRKISRAYTDIWGVPRLRFAQQWRAAVWLLIQIAMMVSVAALRGTWRSGDAAELVLFILATVTVWWVAEFAAQFVLTGGQVPRNRLAIAAAIVTVGRFGIGLWSVYFLAESLANQASSYGPIGVVFAFFTFLVATTSVLLVGTLLASCLAGHDTTPPGPEE